VPLVVDERDNRLESGVIDFSERAAIESELASRGEEGPLGSGLTQPGEQAPRNQRDGYAAEERLFSPPVMAFRAWLSIERPTHEPSSIHAARQGSDEHVEPERRRDGLVVCTDRYTRVRNGTPERCPHARSDLPLAVHPPVPAAWRR
jgi:hypothetical protein